MSVIEDMQDWTYTLRDINKRLDQAADESDPDELQHIIRTEADRLRDTWTAMEEILPFLDALKWWDAKDERRLHRMLTGGSADISEDDVQWLLDHLVIAVTHAILHQASVAQKNLVQERSES